MVAASLVARTGSSMKAFTEGTPSVLCWTGTQKTFLGSSKQEEEQDLLFKSCTASAQPVNCKLLKVFYSFRHTDNPQSYWTHQKKTMSTEEKPTKRDSLSASGRRPSISASGRIALGPRLSSIKMVNPTSLFVISKVTSEVFNEENPPMDWADAGEKFMAVSIMYICNLIHFGLPNNFLCDVIMIWPRRPSYSARSNPPPDENDGAIGQRNARFSGG